MNAQKGRIPVTILDLSPDLEFFSSSSILLDIVSCREVVKPVQVNVPVRPLKIYDRSDTKKQEGSVYVQATILVPLKVNNPGTTCQQGKIQVKKTNLEDLRPKLHSLGAEPTSFIPLHTVPKVEQLQAQVPQEQEEAKQHPPHSTTRGRAHQH